MDKGRKQTSDEMLQSDPTRRGQKKRTTAIWRETGTFEITEQRLADQARVIRTNEWLNEVELEKIRRKISTSRDGEKKKKSMTSL